MMGSAMALLAGAAPASGAPAAPGDAPTPEGADFLVALLAAAPVMPVDPAATGIQLQPAAQEPGEESPDVATSADLAALIAAMQAVPAVVAGGAPAAVEEGEATATATGAADSLAKTAAQLLQQLEQANAAAEQAPVMTAATDAQAPKVVPGSTLQQLLRGMSQHLDAPPSAAPLHNADTAGAGATFALPVLAEAAARAPEVSAAPVTVVQRSDVAQLATDNQPQAPAQMQVATQGTGGQPAATEAPAGQTLHATVGTPRWADELGSRMVLMSLRGQHEGSLSLTPEHLGPLEVRVSVNQGTANVWFGSQHADTRAALTEALPRLRELFGGAGLMLGHAGVSQEAPRQSPRDSEAARLAGSRAGGSEETNAVTPAISRRIALGLVDTYA
jgi:flagellar hook-length control protein FliK